MFSILVLVPYLWNGWKFKCDECYKRFISKNKMVEKSHLYSVESYFIFYLIIQRVFLFNCRQHRSCWVTCGFSPCLLLSFSYLDMVHMQACVCLWNWEYVQCTRHTDKTWFVELRDKITIKIAEIMLFSCNFFFRCLMWIVTAELFVDKLSI